MRVSWSDTALYGTLVLLFAGLALITLYDSHQTASTHIVSRKSQRVHTIDDTLHQLEQYKQRRQQFLLDYAATLETYYWDTVIQNTTNSNQCDNVDNIEVVLGKPQPYALNTLMIINQNRYNGTYLCYGTTYHVAVQRRNVLPYGDNVHNHTEYLSVYTITDQLYSNVESYLFTTSAAGCYTLTVTLLNTLYADYAYGSRPLFEQYKTCNTPSLHHVTTVEFIVDTGENAVASSGVCTDSTVVVDSKVLHKVQSSAGSLYVSEKHACTQRDTLEGRYVQNEFVPYQCGISTLYDTTVVSATGMMNDTVSAAADDTLSDTRTSVALNGNTCAVLDKPASKQYKQQPVRYHIALVGDSVSRGLYYDLVDIALNRQYINERHGHHNQPTTLYTYSSEQQLLLTYNFWFAGSREIYEYTLPVQDVQSADVVLYSTSSWNSKQHRLATETALAVQHDIERLLQHIDRAKLLFLAPQAEYVDYQRQGLWSTNHDCIANTLHRSELAYSVVMSALSDYTILADYWCMSHQRADIAVGQHYDRTYLPHGYVSRNVANTILNKICTS